MKRVVALILLVTLAVIPFYPVKATDFGGAWAQATAYMTKEFGLDLAARVIARNLLNTLTSQLVNKIQTGGKRGGPAFVQNWRNFQLDAEYRGEDVFRTILSSTTLCKYFEKEVKTLFNADKNKIKIKDNVRVGDLNPFSLRARCTLPNNFDFNKYRRDFSGNGGWEAWSRLLEPQNNYYGALFQSLDEANRQRAVEAAADVNEAIAGGGYTSIRDVCKDENVEGPTLPSRARCTFLGQVFTPADLLGKTAASTIDNELGWLVSSDELSEVIVAVMSAVVNRLTNLAFSKPADDYASAPPATGNSTDSFNACVQSCQGDSDCLFTCSEEVVPNLPEPTLEEPSTETPTSTLPSGAPVSLLSDVQAERAKYGTPMTPAEIGKVLNAVAWNNRDTGWVLLGKASGANCPAPSGVSISCDFLVHKPTLSGYDVFIDTEGAGTPTWSGPDPNIPGLVSSGARTLVDPVQP